MSDGTCEGARDEAGAGTGVGSIDEACVEGVVGTRVGPVEGNGVGTWLGCGVGTRVWNGDGTCDGRIVGKCDGTCEGCRLPFPMAGTPWVAAWEPWQGGAWARAWSCGLERG